MAIPSKRATICYVLGDMQQLHKWGAGSSPYALRASTPEEDPNNGEQPERFYQVGGNVKLYPWTRL